MPAPGYHTCAQIAVYAGPTPAEDDTPGNLRIRVTPEESTIPETAIAIDSDCWTGIATTGPSRLLEVNQGSGNMIADGYDIHSLSKYKENIKNMKDLTRDELKDLLERFKKLPLYSYRRVPYVSATELKLAAIERFGRARWDAIYPDTDSHRGGKLKECPDQEIKAYLDARADLLREERRKLPEWQIEHLGLIANEETAALFPSLIARDKEGNIIGISLSEQVGLLHAVLYALVTLYPLAAQEAKLGPTVTEELDHQLETLETEIGAMDRTRFAVTPDRGRVKRLTIPQETEGKPEG